MIHEGPILGNLGCHETIIIKSTYLGPLRLQSASLSRIFQGLLVLVRLHERRRPVAMEDVVAGVKGHGLGVQLDGTVEVSVLYGQVTCSDPFLELQLPF